MLLIDFIITVFCKIDDMLKTITKGKRLRQRGPSPQLSDSEVITMEIVGEYLNKDKEKDIHGYFKRHWSKLFPKIPERTTFARQCANLWAIKQRIRREFVKILLKMNQQPLRIIDGFPMPICNFRRAHFSKIFKGRCAYGYCASKNQNYYGFKGHLLVDAYGTIVDVIVAPANIDEREAIFEMAEKIISRLLGDKGYILKESRKQELKDMGIKVETPLRDNMHETRSTKYLRWMNKTRRIIETVIGQLAERFRIEKVRARDLWHLTNRITRKLLAHNLTQLIARSQGIFNLRFDHLIVA